MEYVAIQVGPGLSQTVCTSGCYYVPNVIIIRVIFLADMPTLCVM